MSADPKGFGCLTIALVAVPFRDTSARSVCRICEGKNVEIGGTISLNLR
jgi:hypothetical protein